MDETTPTPDVSADAEPQPSTPDPGEPQEGDWVIAEWVGPEGSYGWDLPGGTSKTFTRGDLLVVSRGQVYGWGTPVGDMREDGTFVPRLRPDGTPVVVSMPPDPKYRPLTRAEAANVDRGTLWRWNRGRLAGE